MLLSIVLWDQQVWGWSALRTGLAVAPGPLIGAAVLVSWVAGPLIARFGPGRVMPPAPPCSRPVPPGGALAAGLTPDYAGDMLGGMLLTGIGVGLTLPTFMATGASSLPPQSFATGSAVVNMLAPRSVWRSAWRSWSP